MTHLRRFARETHPSRRTLERVRRRALRTAGLTPAGALKTWLPQPTDAALWRVRDATLGAEVASIRPLRQVVLATLAAAAVLALVLVRTLSAPEPLSQPLSSMAEWTDLKPVPAVALHLKGEGELAGDERDLRVLWRSGTVDVELEPGQGVGLVVETDEGWVEVVGTHFSVLRDPLGTHVSVVRGEVRVQCAASSTEPVRVTPGGEALCLPTTAAGALGRANALLSAGASEQEVLQALEGGLAAPGNTGAVAAELEVMRIASLSRLGRHAQALAAAERYLEARSEHRRTDMLGLAAQLAYAQAGCEGARVHLDTLRTERRASTVTERLAHCLEQR